MISRSLLLVLLVLVCLQSFTTANSSNGPKKCCFKYQTHPIPAGYITTYEVTAQQCTEPGVIFTLKNLPKKPVCADPRKEWVKTCMEKINQRLISET